MQVQRAAAIGCSADPAFILAQRRTRMDPLLLGGFAGMLVGLSMGLTGAGGGVLAVPALTMVLGLDVHQAVPLGLLAIGSAALLGSLDGLRHGLVRYRAALFMAAIGVLTASLGTRLAQRLPTDAVMLLFCLVLINIAVRQWSQGMKPIASGIADAACSSRAGWPWTRGASAGRPVASCILPRSAPRPDCSLGYSGSAEDSSSFRSCGATANSACKGW